ncbi:MAG: choice-of-anchor X domain-containing protein [Ignavibacteria bacterium]
MHKIKYFLIPLILGILMYSCEKDDNSVIDPLLHFPLITASFYTPQVLNSDTVGVIAGATVESVDPLEKVEVKFYDYGTNVLVTTQLLDNGVYPDTTAGDGKYTGIISFVFDCRQVGAHKIEFLATTTSGLSSNPIQNTVNIIRSPNQPPVVSGIVITPDSIQSDVSTFFIFMITATDPNGPCDIAKVFYTGFKPNGIQLNLSLELYDDGDCCVLPPFNASSGDTTANDSKFTRKFFGSTIETGYYRYYIRAVDRSGDTSNILTDSIYVY